MQAYLTGALSFVTAAVSTLSISIWTCLFLRVPPGSASPVGRLTKGLGQTIHVSFFTVQACRSNSVFSFKLSHGKGIYPYCHTRVLKHKYVHLY